MSRHVFLLAGQWSRVGGLEIVTQDIACAFRSLGWPVTVLDMCGSGRSETLPNGIEVKRFGIPRLRVFRSLWHRVLRFRVAAQFLRRQKAARNGVLICGHVQLLPVVDAVPPGVLASRWVWTHGVDVWGEEGRRWASRLNQLDRIISVSAYTAQHMRAAGVTSPIIVIPNCVDTDFFVPSRTPECIRREEVLVCGRLTSASRNKGYEVLLEALPLAEKLLGRPLTLRIIGDGDDRGRLEDRARTLGLNGKVVFSGRVSPATLLEAYQHCGVFAMPSRVECATHTGFWAGEGFGLVYVEAAACGRPVIASAEGGAPETIVAGRTGLLVDPRSPGDLARVIAEILSDTQRADEMGRQGRQFAEECFSREQFKMHLKAAIRDLS